MRPSVVMVVLLLWAGAYVRAQEAPLPPPLPGLEDLPVIVARVDQRPLYHYELVREAVASGGMESVERLAQRLLVEQAAAKAGVAITEKELQEQLQYEEASLAKEQILPPLESWDKGLAALVKARYQMTLEEYRDLVVRQKLLIRKLIGGRVAYGEEQLRGFFNSNPQLFQPQTRYRAAHILITPLSPSDLFRGGRLRSSAAYRQRLAEERRQREELWRKQHTGAPIDFSNAPEAGEGLEWADSRAKAAECARRLRDGTLSWERAVALYSQDRGGPAKPNQEPGEVGWFTREGPLVQEFFAAASQLKPGQLSDPVRTEYGYHIIKLLETQTPPPLSFEDCRAYAERTYVDTTIRARAEDWLAGLVAQAQLSFTREKLWPPLPGVTLGEAGDPAAVQVNGQALARSAVWRDLLRTDGPDALQRLINRELALGVLARLGPARVEYEGLPPSLRRHAPPREEPIRINPEQLDLVLNQERLAWDRQAEARAKQHPELPALTWPQYLFDLYGQAPEEFRQSKLAGLIVERAVQRTSPTDEATLRFQYTLMRELFREPPQYDVSHLLIQAAGEDTESRRNALLMAQQFQEQLTRNPETWEELVARHSDDLASRGLGGRLGLLNSRHPAHADLYRAVAAAEPRAGQIMRPIVIRQGVHVVRVERVIPQGILPFEEVKDRVKSEYLRGRAEEYGDLWVRALQRQVRVQRFVYQQEDSGPPDAWKLPPRPEKDAPAPR